MQNNNKLLLGGIAALVVFGVLWMSTSKSTAPTNTTPPVAMEEPESNTLPVVTPEEPETTMEKQPTNLKEFTVEGTEFAFNLKEIRVKKGEMVKITLNNPGKMPHDWKIDALNVATKIIQPGETDTITFIVDKIGTYEYYCSVGQHRANGMFGTLIVEE